MRASLICLFALISACRPAVYTTSQNVHVSSQHAAVPHAEVYLAVDPDDANRMAAVAMRYPDRSGRDRPTVYLSSDGGKTWNYSDVGHTEMAAVDPWVTFLGGSLYYSHLPGIIHSSDDWGRSWSQINVLSDDSEHSLDFPKIVGSQDRASLYLVATNHVRVNEHLFLDPVTIFRVNVASGVVDDVSIRPERINYKNGTPLLTEGDTLIVPFYELLDRERSILADNRIWISLVDPDSLSVLQSFRTPHSGGEVDIVLNRAYRNRLHMVSFGRSGDGFKLQYAHSDDFGATWSNARFIEDFERAPGSFALTASVAVSSDGTLAVLWPDHRTDPTNRAYGMYISVSTDGGESFRPSHLISEISSPDTDVNSQTYIGTSGRSIADRFWVGGDYYGLVPVGQRSFQAAWVDSRTGVAQVWTTRIDVYP